MNNSSYSYKNITRDSKKSPVDDDETEIIGIRPIISRTISRIGKNIEFPQAQSFSERKPERNWKSCG